MRGFAIGGWLVLGGCGPTVIVDEDQDSGTAGTASASSSDADSGSEVSESGRPPDPTSSTSPPTTSSSPSTSIGSSNDDEGTSTTGPGTVDLCEEIQAESTYCLTVSGGGLYLAGLDSGTSCLLVQALPDDSADTNSLAWIGDDVFVCLRDGNGEPWLTRVNLLDGAVTESDVACEAVAAYEGGLLLMPYASQGGFRSYDSFDDAIAGDPSGVIAVDPFASRMTVTDGVLYAAWHATDYIEVWDLDPPSELPQLPLEGHDDWVFGLSVVDDRLFLSSSFPDAMVIEFDANTGARLAEHPLDLHDAWGLVCRLGG